jgi:hypothetical protein
MTVPPEAWEADERARRERGRVEMFNAGRPGGLDGWTMDLRQYEAMRELLLEELADGERPLKELVAAADARYGGGHELFPKGRTRNYLTSTKVDLEARGELERVPGSKPQRVRLAGT